MRYPKWYARRRLLLWDDRVREYRRAWQEAIAKSPAGRELDAVTADVFYERLVTRGMAKRTLWRKRAGIELRQGKP